MGAPLPSSVAEILPGLHAVGGTLPSGGFSYLIPPQLGGAVPVQCYVLSSEGQSLVLDTGLAVHRAAIEAGLASVLPEGQREIVVSRWELDAIINLPWMIERFGIRRLHSVGELDPMDFFTGFDNANIEAQIKARIPRVPRSSMMPGAVIPVGAMRLEVMRTSLRLLLTNWFYEQTTATLFSSDAFGLGSRPGAAGPFVAEPSELALSDRLVRDTLRWKLDWLSGADTAPVIEDLRAFFAERPVARICPAFGGVIEGTEAVARMVEATADAIAALGREPQRSAFHGFDLEAAVARPTVLDVPALLAAGNAHARPALGPRDGVP